ncbi:MAG TPA: glycosyltransferase, partial [Saprospiraceae bacterium]|nr:glycosyltransferase [Saprospiraceae bacterium]
MIAKKTRIRICFVLSHLPEGGAERQTINLIRKLDPEEFDVTLVLYANQEIFYEEILQLPVRIISSPAYRKCKLIKNLKGAIFLRKILIRNQFDLIHTLLFHNGLWVRLLAPVQYSRRIIYSIRNSLEQSSFFERSVEKL